MSNFFDTSGFPPRWQCGEWSPGVGWLTIISDLAIFGAYTALPLTIAWYVRRRREVPFPLIFWLFSAFIFACGATHLLEVVIFWYPLYPLQAVLKLGTALVSIATVLAVALIMPRALAIPGIQAMNTHLQQEIAARTASQGELQRRSEELQRSEDRLLAAQQAARIGDWSFDPTTQQISWSEQVFRLFSRDPRAGPPKDFAENMSLYTSRGAEALEALMARIQGGENRVEGDLEVRLPGDAIAWHHAIVHAQRSPEGAVVRLWGTAQDITAQQSDAAAKDQQRQELLRINQQLEQFAYIASHDLVEPLRKMRFFTDVAMAESEGRLTPEGVDAMQRLSQASERMSSLVRDLLAFARAGKSLVTVKPVALANVLQQSLDRCAAMVRDTGAQLTISDLPEVSGDHLLLVQVFQQLVTNALTYRHPDRPPQIEISATVDDGMVRITVRDRGLGFAPEQAGRLFDPFVRLHPQVVNQGTGIGLAICRRIIGAHNGRIFAVARVDGGAEFTVLLPQMKESPHVN